MAFLRGQPPARAGDFHIRFDKPGAEIERLDDFGFRRQVDREAGVHLFEGRVAPVEPIVGSGRPIRLRSDAAVRDMHHAGPERPGIRIRPGRIGGGPENVGDIPVARRVSLQAETGPHERNAPDRHGAVNQRTPGRMQNHRIDAGDCGAFGVAHDDMLRGKPSGDAPRQFADLQMSRQRAVHQALGSHAERFPALLRAGQGEEGQNPEQPRVQGEPRETAQGAYDVAGGQGAEKFDKTGTPLSRNSACAAYGFG